MIEDLTPASAWATVAILLLRPYTHLCDDTHAQYVVGRVRLITRKLHVHARWHHKIRQSILHNLIWKLYSAAAHNEAQLTELNLFAGDSCTVSSVA